MIKKLTLITFVAFLAIGVLLPHSLKASPAGDNILNVVSPKLNKSLINFETSTCTGFFCDFIDGATTLVRSHTYTNTLITIGKDAGVTDIKSLTNENINAYFNSGNNNSAGGLTGILSTINATLIDQRPASGVDYVNEKVYAITNPGTVYAAANPSTYYPGPGSELLRPIQGFWGWSVNLVFGFLVLIILVVALAIMFRQRLGGAAEVTIQTAIPSIALAMILIPLSYAISGLFIDAITLGTNAVHGFLLGPQSPGSTVYNNRPSASLDECDLQSTDVAQGITCDRGYYADDPSIDVWRARDRIDIRDAGAQVGAGINNALGGVPSAKAIFNVIGGILKLLPGDENTFSDYAWFGNVINIIIGVLTIWIALKIFWRLINKYLTLIIMPAFSPFIFATAALPGNGTKSIVSYLKTMGSAALFYIVTYAMFVLTLIFTDSSFQNSLPDFRTSGYIPPLLGLQKILTDLTSTSTSFPLTQLLMTLVGLGIYFSIPKTLDGIDEALGTKFVLPQLLKTPFESMSESFKIATRAAPAAVASAAKISGTGARNLASAAFTTRYRARVALQKAQGINTDIPGGATYERRQKFLAQRQDVMAKLSTERNIAKRASLQGELAKINAAESLYGINTQADGEKKQSMSVKMNFFSEASSNKYAFTNADIANLYAKALAAPGTALDVDIGKLVLSAENFQFSSGGGAVKIGYTKPVAGTGDTEYDVDLPIAVGGGAEIFGMPTPGSGSYAPREVIPPAAPTKNSDFFFASNKDPIPGLAISLYSLKAFGDPEKENTTISTVLQLKILPLRGNVENSLNVLFGNRRNVGGVISGQGTIGTPERAFIYKNFESSPIKFTIGSAGR